MRRGVCSIVARGWLKVARRDSMVVGFDLCPAKTLALLSHDEAMLAPKRDAT